jgi:thiol-disulfide isomerase/thioredoxin
MGRVGGQVVGRAVGRIGHEAGSSMRRTGRRTALAVAAGTLAAAALPIKSQAQKLQPVAGGIQRVSPPAAPPDLPFVAQDGSEHRLSEFKGKGMVVNMWATWCAPCVAEMPSLQALAKALAPQDIAVLPLSSDRGGAEAVAEWYRDHGITALPVLLDPKGAIAQAVKARGIPTTLIIDTSNLIVARLEGGADWSSPEAEALIRKLVAT